MKKKKSILFIIPKLEMGGAEKSLINLLNEIDFSMYNIDLLLLKEECSLKSEIPYAVNIIDIPSDIAILYGGAKKNRKKFLYYRIIRFLSTFIARIYSKNKNIRAIFRWKYFYENCIHQIDKKYDVAISFLEGDSAYILSSKINSKRKIAWFHSDYSAYEYNNFALSFENKIYNNIDLIVAVSDKCRDILKQFYPNYSNKIIFLPNINSKKVIDMKSNMFYPKEFIKGINIVSVGRLSPEKAFDRVIYIAKKMKNNHIRFKWFIIGEGNDRNKLEELITKEKVEQNVELLGIRKNPYPYIKNAKLLVQTSIYEGKSLVIDESKILGTPIVITDYPSANDQVTIKEGIIAKQDIDSLYNSIFLMLNDEEKYNSIKKHLKSKMYDNSNIIQDYYDIFEGR